MCGRNFEYVSEDPLLSGVLGAAMVDGIQSVGVGTSLKHYAVNNQETDRLRVSADVDERPLREIYLKGFEHVVRTAQPWTVMCAYNKVNGTYASQHRWLLTEVLRDEWGFEGVVVSDWGAVDDRVAAVAAGLDLEMPPNLAESAARIVAAVRAGTLDEAVVDLAATRLLQLVARTQQTDGTVVADMDEHHRIAREAAQDSAVLLRNVGDILPLQLSTTSRLAVVGEFASTPRYQGAGSSRSTRPGSTSRSTRSVASPPRAPRSRSRRASASCRAMRTTRCARRRWWRPAPPTRCCCSSVCRRRPSPKASTAPTWSCRRTRSRCWTRSRR